jgi:hypothetical protein
VRHTILHVKWKNPQNALQLAAVFGMADVTQEIQQTMALQAQAAQQGQPPQPPVSRSNLRNLLNNRNLTRRHPRKVNPLRKQRKPQSHPSGWELATVNNLTSGLTGF